MLVPAMPRLQSAGKSLIQDFLKFFFRMEDRGTGAFRLSLPDCEDPEGSSHQIGTLELLKSNQRFARKLLDGCFVFDLEPFWNRRVSARSTGHFNENYERQCLNMQRRMLKSDPYYFRNAA